MGFKRRPSSRRVSTETENDYSRDQRRGIVMPHRRERMRNSSSPDLTPEMTSYTRRRNRNDDHDMWERREQCDKLHDYRERSSMLSSFDEDDFRRDHRCVSYERFSVSRDRSRSPLSPRNYQDSFRRYGDFRGRSPIRDSFDPFDNHEVDRRDQYLCNGYSEGFDQRSAFRREEGHFTDRELGFAEQRRKHKTTDKRNPSWTSGKFSNSAKTSRVPLSICKFYNNEGTCKRGQSCDYLHVCKYFINNDCKFGNGCMRSHNVLDVQARSILTKYGIVLDYYDRRDNLDIREATRLVKEKLDSQDAKPKIDISRKTYPEETQNVKVRPILMQGKSLFNIVSDIGNTSDMDSEDSMDNNNTSLISSISKSSKGTSKHETDIPHQTFTEEDYIPLERKQVVDSKTAPVIKTKILTRKLKKKSTRLTSKLKKKSKRKVRYDDEDLTLAKIEDNIIVPGLFQSKITFEISGPSGKFQVRKDNDHWEISTISGEWSNLPEDSNREMEDVYCRVMEIKDKVYGPERTKAIEIEGNCLDRRV